MPTRSFESTIKTKKNTDHETGIFLGSFLRFCSNLFSVQIAILAPPFASRRLTRPASPDFYNFWDFPPPNFFFLVAKKSGLSGRLPERAETVWLWTAKPLPTAGVERSKRWYNERVLIPITIWRPFYVVAEYKRHRINSSAIVVLWMELRHLAVSFLFYGIAERRCYEYMD